jgi:hypothetical protein
LPSSPKASGLGLAACLAENDHQLFVHMSVPERLQIRSQTGRYAAIPTHAAFSGISVQADISFRSDFNGVTAGLKSFNSSIISSMTLVQSPAVFW